MNAIKSIAACARPACATGRFNANPYVGISKRESSRAASCSGAARRVSSNCEVSGVSRVQAPIHAGSSRYPMIFSEVSGVSGPVTSALGGATSWRCDSIHAGAQHTTKQASKLYVNELFSRPEFAKAGVPALHGFGAGSAYPQGRQHNLFCVLKPSSTLCPQQADGGFQFNKERETMTKVNTLTAPKAAPLGITPATFPGSVQRQIAIETALADALYYIRMPGSVKALNAATARTRRALTLLKNACSEAKNGGAQ